MANSSSTPLLGELTVPGDKSISHRSIMFGAISKGLTEITHFLNGADCLSTISCFRQMGVDIEQRNEKVLVHGKGLYGLSKPSSTLDAGNSGTTIRLLSGILSGQSFDSVITGDSSVQKRPMERIIVPLKEMGADICSENGNGCAPLKICAHPLHGISYLSPISSAQVKSCIMLAGLYADGATIVTEPVLSRNHTELMLNYMGADIDTEICPSGSAKITVNPGFSLSGRKIDVPGDFSSAAFFIAAALIVPGSEILLKNVGINPTRCGMLQICRSMGADITVLNENSNGPEPSADLLVKYSHLKGVTIGGDIIPTLIDELPILAVLAAFAEGTTTIKDASELHFKESDRINVMTDNLNRIGASVTSTQDGMIIDGGKSLHGAVIDAHKDHRVAMSFAVAGLACSGEMKIPDAECVSISYPGFYKDLLSLTSASHL